MRKIIKTESEEYYRKTAKVPFQPSFKMTEVNGF